ncbi:MAG TPA: 50S ribosomal protein L24 [Dehalococcoidia bacterium]
MAQKIKSNDMVKVIAGKDRGKEGQVRQVLPKRGRAVVQGVNMVKKHLRARGPNQPGGIVEREAPIHLSNLMLICRHCSKATRVGFRFRDDGKKVRYCKSCNEDID